MRGLKLLQNIGPKVLATAAISHRAQIERVVKTDWAKIASESEALKTFKSIVTPELIDVVSAAKSNFSVPEGGLSHLQDADLYGHLSAYMNGTEFKGEVYKLIDAVDKLKDSNNPMFQGALLKGILNYVSSKGQV